MGGRDILKEKLQKFLQTILGDHQQSKKVVYLLVIAVIALFLLILGNSFSANENNSQSNMTDPIEEPAEETVKKESTKDLVVSDLEESYETDLKKMLEKIQGVSEVDVMVNLDSTDIKIYEKNLIKGQQTTNETDSNGGVRKVEDETEENEIVFVRQGDQEVPLLIQTKKPKDRGVFVVAKEVDQG